MYHLNSKCCYRDLCSFWQILELIVRANLNRCSCVDQQLYNLIVLNMYWGKLGMHNHALWHIADIFFNCKLQRAKIDLSLTEDDYSIIRNTMLEYQSILQSISQRVAMEWILLFLSASTNEFAVFLWFSGTSTNKIGCMSASCDNF